MRRTIAQRMQASKREAPHIYLTVEVGMDEAGELRSRINATLDQEEDPRVTYTDLIIRATALALAEFPELNCRLDGEEIVYLNEVNLGMAVGVDEGLLVPVLRHADRKTITEIAQETKSLALKAREGRLKPEEYSGGSFTLSNLGMYGIDDFQAIINPPESAILAVGRIAERVVPVNGEPGIANMMYMTLSCDHRVVDGVLGARFLGRIREMLEEPFRILL